jgi:hypothetical protein
VDDHDGTYINNAEKISLGSAHSCAVTVTTNVYCWGYAANGRLGDGTTTPNKFSPVRVLKGEAAVDDHDGTYLNNIEYLSGGTNHTCAVSASGVVYCWGASSSGQLGNSTTTPDQSSPVLVLKGEAAAEDHDGTYLDNIVGLSSGNEFSCAVSNSGSVYCWGSSSYGKLGTGFPLTEDYDPDQVLNLINYQNSTLQILGTGQFGGEGDWVVHNLVLGDGTADELTALDTGGITITGQLYIHDGMTFNTGLKSYALESVDTPFVNNGIFVGDSSTIIVDNAYTATFENNGTLEFNDFNAVVPGQTLIFDSGSIYNFSGDIIITGSPEDNINIRSTKPGEQWLVYFDTAQSLVSYAALLDSGCADGTANASPANSTNSGNNGTCWFAVVTGVTISGTIYSDAGVTVLASTPTVRVKVNGLGDYSAAANGSGVYSIADVGIGSIGDVITVYLDDEVEKAVTLTITSDGVSDVVNLNLYQNHVILRHEDAGPVTNADIGQYDSTDDTDVMLTVSAETGLVVDPALTLLVWSGHTYAPETDVVAETLVIDGTLNLNLNDPEVTVNDLTIEGSLSASNISDLIVSGDFTNNGTFTHNNGTVVFIGSSDSVISSGEGSDIVFYNFTSNNSAGKTIQFEAGEPTKFEGALILAGTQEGQLTINSTTSTQWELWVTGSISVSRLVIKNSGCYAGTESITANPTVLNGGNNDTSCWLFIVRGGGGGTSSTGGQGPGGEGAEGGGGAGGGTSSTGTQGPGGEGAEGGGGAGNGGNASP